MKNCLQSQLLRVDSKAKIFGELVYLKRNEESIKLLPVDLEEKNLDSTEELLFTASQGNSCFMFLGEVLEDTTKENCFYVLMFSFEHSNMCWLPLVENNKLEQRVNTSQFQKIS